MGLISAVSEEVSPCCIRSDLYSQEYPADVAGKPASLEKRKCPTVMRVLSSLLERVVARNERLPVPSQGDSHKKFSAFFGLRVPVISIEQYLERIFKYANCSTSCFVVAYAYIDRLVQFQPDLHITSLNVHRILITSILVSAKFLDDSYYDNAYYAQIGGITTQEMNKLEWDFLFLLDFRLQSVLLMMRSRSPRSVVQWWFRLHRNMWAQMPNVEGGILLAWHEYLMLSSLDGASRLKDAPFCMGLKPIC